MRLARRAFLRLLAVGAAAGVLRPRSVLAADSAASIHRATSNTLLGAIAEGIRHVRSPLPPFKAYEGKPRLSLGDVPSATGASFDDALVGRMRGSHGAEDAGARPLTREQLGRLLFFTNGDTGRGDNEPYRLRAAPSAGALYAGEIYVLALSVEGLDRAAYSYDVGKHELVRLSDALDGDALEQAFESSGLSNASALVCIANVFERYEIRYANRGYRYALIDTGHIGENLALASAALKIAEQPVSRFYDDRLNEVLGLDGRDEAVCAVHSLGGRLAEQRPVRRFVEKRAAGGKLAGDPEPARRYHEASKLVPETVRPEHGRKPVTSAPTSPSPQTIVGERVPLATPAALAQKPLTGCIVARRSPPAFATRPISAVQLAFVCRAARPRGQAGLAELVEVAVVSHRVESLEPGLYGYLPDEESLVVRQKADLRESLPRACLAQAKAGDAAAGFLVIGRLRRATALRGERAYRDVLVEAGRTAERVYLAAEAMGLRARNLAAFLDEDLNDLIGLDGNERAVVHLTMVGHAA